MAHLDPRRRFHVTGSDVAAICGENAYENRRGVLFKKVFRIMGEESEATRHGHKYEPVAAQKFIEKTGYKVEFPGYCTSEKYPWLGGTLDGLVTLPDGRRAVLEIKCPLKRQIKENDLPGQYVGQVQTYMEIYDLDLLFFVQYKPPGVRAAEKFTIMEVRRDRAYMALRLPILCKFYQEMMVTSAYAEAVVVVMQRAWRAYLAKKALKTAFKKARAQLVSRMSVANTVGKIAGFMARRKLSDVQAAALMRDTERAFNRVWVEYDLVRVGWRGPRSKRAANPVHDGSCHVAYAEMELKRRRTAGPMRDSGEADVGPMGIPAGQVCVYF